LSKIPEKCPRCGTALNREVSDFKGTVIGSGSANFTPSVPVSMGSADSRLISQDISGKYVYKCPKCGYMFVDW
jgi:uncharacterized C2H2 Zn-finger protein